VPGEVHGFYTAWERYGIIPWTDLFQPSIQLCEQGFIVERSLSSAIAQYEEEIRADPNLGYVSAGRGRVYLGVGVDSVESPFSEN
jgi:gamma-glutamyltranspeptidase/glutathione hydrolase/leukotriene-C4 hydrolase